mmetsp:Transcript_4851/g.7130  ORF Transcript_4851/g.7130 Transcript_4851/m.7130 type:complete len:279 (+) Transcript_4851:160-996(+)
MSQGLFGNVPRPGASAAASDTATAAASQGFSQMSSWMSSVSDAGKQALTKVQANQHVAALQGTASKLAQDAQNTVRASPIATVGSFAAQQAEATKTLMTGQQREPESMSDYVDEAMSLSYKKRLIGFGILLASGIFFTALSTVLLPLIVLKPHKFAVAYSLGNLLMMTSTVFLVGPKKQCQNMWSGHRALASGCYFGSMVGTIYTAMVLRIYLLVLVFIGIQFVSLVWYSLSYIPYGRQLFQRFILPALKPILKVVSACLWRVCGVCCQRCVPSLLPR